MDRKRVFIHSDDEELAVMLVKLLDRNGVTGFWVTQEAGEKLKQIWEEDARITEQHAHISMGD